MSLPTFLMLKLGPALAKAVLKVLLADYKFLGELAPELLDMLKDKTAEEQVPPEDARYIVDIGLQVAQRMRALFSAEATMLGQAEQTTLITELLTTLRMADINANMVIKFNLDAEKLSDYLLDLRQEIIRDLDSDCAALYFRLLTEAASTIVSEADRLSNYDISRDQALLQATNRTHASVTELLDRPNIEAERFERAYRAVVRTELEKIELFGVPMVDDKARRQQVSVAYITPDIEPTSSAYAKTASDRNAPDRSLRFDTVPEQLDRSFSSQAASVNQMLISARRIVITGEAGCGKTTLAQWIALRSASRDFPPQLKSWNNTIPFFIRLRALNSLGHSQSFPTPEEFPDLVAQGMAGTTPINWVRDQLQSGRAVVLVDGVDELPEIQRVQMLSALEKLLKLYPSARYLITSRPLRVKEQPWLEWEDWLEQEQFVQARLLDMTQQNIDAFIDHWHEALMRGSRPTEHPEMKQLAPALKELLQQRRALYRLATNPLLCAMICALHHDRRDNLPSERVELYNACIETLILRDSGRKISLNEEFPQLTPEQKRRLIQEFAYAFARSGNLDISREDADQRFNYELAQMDVLPGTTGHNVTDLFIRRVRLLQEPVVGRVQFVHRTFQEFLTARAIVQSGGFDELFHYADDDQWRETIVLAAGMVHARQSDRLLYGILNCSEVSNEKKGWRALLKREASIQWIQPEQYRRRLTLALACLETCVQRSPAIHTKVLQQAESLFPPKSMSEAKLLAAAGPTAIPLLRYRQDYKEAEAIACIHALTLIGGRTALDALGDFAEDGREAVIRALSDGWDSFDRNVYAERVLKHVKTLTMRSFTSWDGLERLTELHVLNLKGTRVKDLNRIQMLTKLISLDLSQTDITDLEPLRYISDLCELNIRNTNISNIYPIQDLINLKKLGLSKTFVKDIAPIQYLHNLDTLDLIGLGMSDFTPLKSLSRLTRLDISDTRIDDLTPLQNLTTLEWLILISTRVSDITPIRNLTNLIWLSLSDTQVINLSSLQTLDNLTTLEMKSTRVNDITPLQSLTNLNRLDLGHTQVSDLTPLQSLNKLTELNLSDTPVRDLRPLSGLVGLRRLGISSILQDKLIGLEELTNLEIIYTDYDDWKFKLISP